MREKPGARLVPQGVNGDGATKLSGSALNVTQPLSCKSAVLTGAVNWANSGAKNGIRSNPPTANRIARLRSIFLCQNVLRSTSAYQPSKNSAVGNKVKTIRSMLPMAVIHNANAPPNAVRQPAPCATTRHKHKV